MEIARISETVYRLGNVDVTVSDLSDRLKFETKYSSGHTTAVFITMSDIVSILTKEGYTIAPPREKE